MHYAVIVPYIPTTDIQTQGELAYRAMWQCPKGWSHIAVSVRVVFLAVLCLFYGLVDWFLLLISLILITTNIACSKHKCMRLSYLANHLYALCLQV